ncbi:hypothetical protein [Nocardioides sp. YIM 152588]|uniref:hypothetical protein n=1 Tax=Nocardioides sp. YIM 152588 TaxID=3158259 RepID=UPI0032E519C0
MESHRIDLSLPPRWATRRQLPHGVVVAARPLDPGPGPVPEVVVRAVAVDEPDLATWRERALRELADHAVDLALEDDDTFDLAGRTVRYHRFAHRVGPDDLLSEQWSWWQDGVGVTLTGSVARTAYVLYCDLFEEIAATLEITPTGMGGADGGGTGVSAAG